jgi:hypothetical protein
MGNIALFRSVSNKMVGLGVLYILAAAMQVWFWGDTLLVKHPDWIGTFLRAALQSRLPYTIGFCVIAMYYILAVVVIAWLFYIGGKLIWLSYSSSATIYQYPRHRLEMLKAAGFLVVVPGIMLLMSQAHPINDFAEVFLTHLFGFMMVGYSFFAVTQYKGNP